MGSGCMAAQAGYGLCFPTEGQDNRRGLGRERALMGSGFLGVRVPLKTQKKNP